VSKTERRAAIGREVVRILKEERIRCSLSINRVAMISGLSQSTVSRLESNPINPTIDSMLRVADVLELNLGDVFQRAISNVESSRRKRS
jgi:transcriptional regulator with XRE-family HTH domain